MHLCRLLRMGHEILMTGQVNVRRPDADWLRSIRNGALAYEELLAWSRGHLDALPQLTARSPLPEQPYRDAADRLVIELHTTALERSDA